MDVGHWSPDIDGSIVQSTWLQSQPIQGDVVGHRSLQTPAGLKVFQPSHVAQSTWLKGTSSDIGAPGPPTSCTGASLSAAWTSCTAAPNQ